jgi:hypothetical protein
MPTFYSTTQKSAGFFLLTIQSRGDPFFGSWCLTLAGHSEALVIPLFGFDWFIDPPNYRGAPKSAAAGRSFTGKTILGRPFFPRMMKATAAVGRLVCKVRGITRREPWKIGFIANAPAHK